MSRSSLDRQERLEHWQAQRPSAGFADRVTAAVLEERARAHRAPRRRGWIVLAMAACLTIAGAAWAEWSAPRRSSPDAMARGLDEEPRRVERQDPVGSAAPRVFPSVTDLPVPAPVTSGHVRPALVVAPSASAASPPRVPAPSCLCNAFACDCGPE